MSSNHIGSALKLFINFSIEQILFSVNIVNKGIYVFALIIVCEA